MTWEGRALLLFFVGVLNGVTHNVRCGMKPASVLSEFTCKGTTCRPRSFLVPFLRRAGMRVLFFFIIFIVITYVHSTWSS